MTFGVALMLLSDFIEQLKRCGRYDDEIDYISLRILLDDFINVSLVSKRLENIQPENISALISQEISFGESLKAELSFFEVYSLKCNSIKKKIHELIDGVLEARDGEAQIKKAQYIRSAIDEYSATHKVQNKFESSDKGDLENATEKEQP